MFIPISIDLMALPDANDTTTLENVFKSKSILCYLSTKMEGIAKVFRDRRSILEDEEQEDSKPAATAGREKKRTKLAQLDDEGVNKTTQAQTSPRVLQVGAGSTLKANLPDLVLEDIFSFGNLKDLLRFRAVSKGVKAVCHQHMEAQVSHLLETESPWNLRFTDDSNTEAYMIVIQQGWTSRFMDLEGVITEAFSFSGMNRGLIYRLRDYVSKEEFDHIYAQSLRHCGKTGDSSCDQDRPGDDEDSQGVVRKFLEWERVVKFQENMGRLEAIAHVGEYFRYRETGHDRRKLRMIILAVACLVLADDKDKSICFSFLECQELYRPPYGDLVKSRTSLLRINGNQKIEIRLNHEKEQTMYWDED